MSRGPERPEIALTFDDGPSRWTAEIAAAFEAHGCAATFFLRGAAVEERPETVAALAAAGHELGNHLWSHADPASQSAAQIRVEIERTAEAVRAAGAPRPRLVRPPTAGRPKRSPRPRSVPESRRWSCARSGPRTGRRARPRR